MRKCKCDFCGRKGLIRDYVMPYINGAYGNEDDIETEVVPEVYHLCNVCEEELALALRDELLLRQLV